MENEKCSKCKIEMFGSILNCRVCNKYKMFLFKLELPSIIKISKLYPSSSVLNYKTDFLSLIIPINIF